MCFTAIRSVATSSSSWASEPFASSTVVIVSLFHMLRKTPDSMSTRRIMAMTPWIANPMRISPIPPGPIANGLLTNWRQLSSWAHVSATKQLSYNSNWYSKNRRGTATNELNGTYYTRSFCWNYIKCVIEKHAKAVYIERTTLSPEQQGSIAPAAHSVIFSGL